MIRYELLDDYELNEIPIYSEELIKILDKRLPEKSYDITMTKEENIYYSGQRALINSLLLLQCHKNEN